MIARNATILTLAAMLSACGGSGRSQPTGEDLAAVRAVDEDRPRTDASPTPVTGEAPVVSAMPAIPVQAQPTPAIQTTQGTPVLATSMMADRPVIAQPTAANGQPGAGGSMAEAIPSYPPRRGITTGRLCAAAVGAIMNRTEMQVGIDYESPTVARVGYKRADGIQWTYDCRFDGAHITWRAVEDGRPGRWRTDPADEVITYAITPGGATVTVNGEAVRIAG